MSSEQIYLNDQDKVCSPENATQMINYTFENDVLVGVERFYPDNNSIQEAQAFEEHKHPRDEDGKFATGAGSGAKAGEQSAGLVKQDRNKVEYFENKYSEYEQYDPQFGHPSGTKAPTGEPDLSAFPSPSHYATAYSILRDYPELDEQATIKNAWLADKEIDAHNRSMKVLGSQMQHAISAELPYAQVSSRVKNRYAILEKMAKKPNYKQPSDLGDISGYRIIGRNNEETARANEIARGVATLDPSKREDTREKPKMGYRAIHEEIILPDGRRGELQIKTPNQAIWADFVHNTGYKPDLRTKTGRMVSDNKAEFTAYTDQVSEYFYQVDNGNTNMIKPVCPEKFRSINVCL